MAITIKKESPSKQTLKVLTIPIEQIKILPQVRQDIDEDFDSAEMTQLVDSIETNGLLNPITVRRDQDGTLILVAGHRRLNACKKLGYTEVLATLANFSEEEATFIQLTENITRKDLRFYDISAHIAKIAKLINPQTGKIYTQEEIGKRLGMNQADISRHLSLSNADAGIMHLCKSGKINSLRGACALMELYRVSFPAAQRLIRMDRLSFDMINQELRSVKNILKDNEGQNDPLLKAEKMPAMFIDEHGATDMKIVSPPNLKAMLEADPIYNAQAKKDNQKHSMQYAQSKIKEGAPLDDDLALTVVTLDALDEPDVPSDATNEAEEETDGDSDTDGADIFDVETMEQGGGMPGRFIRVSVQQRNGEVAVGELNFDENSTVNRKTGQTFVQIILDSGEEIYANVNNIKILEIGDR